MGEDATLGVLLPVLLPAQLIHVLLDAVELPVAEDAILDAQQHVIRLVQTFVLQERVRKLATITALLIVTQLAMEHVIQTV